MARSEHPGSTFPHVQCVGASASDMACYSPITAYVARRGGITFKRDLSMGREIQLPCRGCIGCRLAKAGMWAVRCVHEAQMHEENCFITLTYAPEHLPQYGSLNPDDWTKFCKKLRKSIEPKKLRFLQCGEYGEDFARPHHHALIFGYDFPDQKLWKTEKGQPIYVSEKLTKLWGKGHCTVGTVTYQSAAYCARYTMKKVNGQQAEAHYTRTDKSTGEIINMQPEYVTMSRRPGLGHEWYEKYNADIFPDNFVVIQTKKGEPAKRMNVPDYYLKLLEKHDPLAYEELKKLRRKYVKENPQDRTPERLKVRKTVLEAKTKNLKRTIHTEQYDT